VFILDLPHYFFIHIKILAVLIILWKNLDSSDKIRTFAAKYIRIYEKANNYSKSIIHDLPDRPLGRL